MSFANRVAELAKHLRETLHDESPSYQPLEPFLASLTPAHVLQQLRFLEHVFRPVGVGKGSLLEVGSGYGFNLLYLAHLGFRTCHGIEIVPSIFSLSRKVLAAAPRFLDRDLSGCEVFEGDAERTSFEDGSYDRVLAIEMISHSPSIDRLLRETNRLLAPDGIFVISDGNNIGCRSYRRVRFKKWAAVRERELPLRVAFIRRKFPDVGPQGAASLALHTELYSREALLAIIPQTVEGGPLPMALHAPGTAPVYFDTGVWDEAAFYPPSFRHDLRGYGFKASVRIYAGGGRTAVYALAERLVNMLPDRLRFTVRPTFLCYARKVGPPTYLVVAARNPRSPSHREVSENR